MRINYCKVIKNEQKISWQNLNRFLRLQIKSKWITRNWWYSKERNQNNRNSNNKNNNFSPRYMLGISIKDVIICKNLIPFPCWNKSKRSSNWYIIRFFHIKISFKKNNVAAAFVTFFLILLLTSIVLLASQFLSIKEKGKKSFVKNIKKPVGRFNNYATPWG